VFKALKGEVRFLFKRPTKKTGKVDHRKREIRRTQNQV